MKRDFHCYLYSITIIMIFILKYSHVKQSLDYKNVILFINYFEIFFLIFISRKKILYIMDLMFRLKNKYPLFLKQNFF